MGNSKFIILILIKDEYQRVPILTILEYRITGLKKKKKNSYLARYSWKKCTTTMQITCQNRLFFINDLGKR